MEPACEKYIDKALNSARRLAILADQGEEASCDNGCILLFSVVRECAYRIRGEAERERAAHRCAANGNMALSLID